MIFLAPLALAGLLTLPLLYWLIKASPPPPHVQSFPSLQILRRLTPGHPDTARSPLWLLILRLLTVAFLVIGLAQPVWLERSVSTAMTGDLALVLDNGWASVPHWQDRLRAAHALAERSFRDGHSVTLFLAAPDPDGNMAAPFTTSDRHRFEERLLALSPHSWPNARAALAKQIDAYGGQHLARHIVFLSDGVATTDDQALHRQLTHSGLRAHDMRWSDCETTLLSAGNSIGGDLTATVSALPCSARSLQIRARAEDGGTLGTVPAPVTEDGQSKTITLTLPTLLRNRVARLALETTNGPLPGPGAIALIDAGLRRHPVGLLTPGPDDTPLTGQGFFLAQAIKSVAELHRGQATPLLEQKISVLIATDGTLSDEKTRHNIAAWVQKGGVLIRFAGPALAEQTLQGNPSFTLLPVPLMNGMRQLGGPMSWGTPQILSGFSDNSPFTDLPVPKDVTVSRQVLAQPTQDLSAHVWARLGDGTPLVTATKLGEGTIVLFHVTGTADWSNLPLSGLFPDMLSRLISRSLGQSTQGQTKKLAPFAMLDAHGLLVPPVPATQSLSSDLATRPKPDVHHPPGLYGPLSGRTAFNLAPALSPIMPESLLGTALTPDHVSSDCALGPFLICLSLLLLLADALISLRLRGLLGRMAAIAALTLTMLPSTYAETLPPGVPDAALETRLAYVLTGHDDIDTASREGLQGLSNYATDRSSAVMGHPDGVTPGKDDLAFYPLIYWPVTDDIQEDPARSAALNSFMSHGGILMLDTQGTGSDIATHDEGTMRAALGRATAGLTVPPLSKLDYHHVLAHSFYLLHDFPGRVQGQPVWVARSGDDSNDDVSPIIIGAGDWAHAWAMDAQGNTPYAVIPGGEDQRTQAYRFGVNILLYALTGNYKADQMRVPKLLKRMEQ